MGGGNLGKSLDFIKQRIIDGCCSHMDVKNYETAHEFDFNDFIKLSDKKNTRIVLQGQSIKYNIRWRHEWDKGQ